MKIYKCDSCEKVLDKKIQARTFTLELASGGERAVKVALYNAFTDEEMDFCDECTKSIFESLSGLINDKIRKEQ